MKERIAMGKYKRDEIMRRLEKKGLKAKYCKGTQVLSHFESPAYLVLGNKCRGYLDFLRANIVRRKPRGLQGNNKPRYQNKRARCWSFAWFTNKAEAEEWIVEQKIRKIFQGEIEKTEVVQTADLEFRACVQGVQ